MDECMGKMELQVVDEELDNNEQKRHPINIESDSPISNMPSEHEQLQAAKKRKSSSRATKHPHKEANTEARQTMTVRKKANGAADE